MNEHLIIDRKDITLNYPNSNCVYEEVTYFGGRKQIVKTKHSIHDQLRKGHDGKIISLIQYCKYEHGSPVRNPHGSGIIVK